MIYVPVNEWQQVGIALTGAEVRFNGVVSVYVGPIPPAEDTFGMTYDSTDFYVPMPPGDLWVKGINTDIPASGPVSHVVVRTKTGELLPSDDIGREVIAPKPVKLSVPVIRKFRDIEPKAVLSIVGKYQSLGLGPNGGTTQGPEGQNSNVWVRAQYPALGGEMFAGLTRGDNVPVTQISGPLLAGFLAGTESTGVSSTINVGNVPLEALILMELRARGLFSNKFNTMFSSAGGQSMANLENGTPYANYAKLAQEFKRQYADKGVGVRYLVDLLIQGEADSNMTAAQYKAAYYRVDRKQRAALAAQGLAHEMSSVPRAIFQTGGYVNSTGHVNGNALAQLEIAKEDHQLFIGPIHQFLINDNNVHPVTMQEYMRMVTLTAWAIEEWAAGRPWNLFSIGQRVEGNNVFLHYPMKDGEYLVPNTDKFAPYGGITNFGFQHTVRTVQEVEMNCGAPGVVRVRLNGPHDSGVLKLGRQIGDMRSFAVENRNYGSQRVGIETNLTSESAIYAGVVANRVLPSEEWPA